MASLQLAAARSLQPASGIVQLQCLYAPARQRLAQLRASFGNVHGAEQRLCMSSRANVRNHEQLQRRCTRTFLPLSTGNSVGATCAEHCGRLGRRGLKTIEQENDRRRLGPFSMLSAGLFVAAGFGLYFYFRYEKERLERLRIAEATKGVGKPKVGGPFELVDQDGKAWNSGEKMDGKYALVYFGFSHCPDICPEELDKMAEMLGSVEDSIPPTKGNPELLPVFITCDPARDSPEVLKTYLKEFHPDIIGLTGTWEQIKAVCRLYRVYFSTPSGVRPGQDYLVDHSIYFYLMDPEGDFVEAIGRQHTAEQGSKLIIDHMKDWKGKTG